MTPAPFKLRAKNSMSSSVGVVCDGHFGRNFVASQGFDLPDYFELMTVDDVPVFYYDSNTKGASPAPEWMNSTTAQQFRGFIPLEVEIRKLIVVNGLKSATQQFNVTGASTNIYQAHGRCELNPDGTAQAFLDHAFNGKDFVSLDFETKSFVAAVPQAVLYKTLRERDETYLEFLVYFYRTRCVEGIKQFLQQSPMKKVPEVMLVERKNSAFTEITCHVTGFYPQTVQVQWFGSDMQPVVEGIIEGEVLPNGDGSYQIRKSVVIPAEHTDIHNYTCVVQHSSIPGNTSKTWGEILLNPILSDYFQLLFLGLTA
ncbi:major histocompatibility complex class I-related gene protein-like [Chanos chanos]|uniref:Major histocompatibility complex class I-related gene protein-like n=1 Tax=Chanos chanos TaxID=29144 RepID=A0A6J2WJ02_CHACN|nr:major histocompatibility complex class I-related gene protein-like [Chanos chanos]